MVAASTWWSRAHSPESPSPGDGERNTEAPDPRGVWRLQLRGQGLSTTAITGWLALDGQAERYSGYFSVDGYPGDRPSRVTGHRENSNSIELDVPDTAWHFTLHADASNLEGRYTHTAWDRDSGVLFGTRVQPRLVDPERRLKSYTVSKPAGTVNRPLCIDLLAAMAQESGSSSLIVLHRRHVICERYFGESRSRGEPLQSISKAITSLAVVQLLNDRTIGSLDTPVADFIPEFSRDERAAITLRHVLSHTSGLDASASSDIIDRSIDVSARARQLRLVSAPGTNYDYNNLAFQLIADVVAAASKRPFHQFVDGDVLAPMGIQGLSYAFDAEGTAVAYGGMETSAENVAQLGLALLEPERPPQPDPGRSRINLLMRPALRVTPRMSCGWFLQYDSSSPVTQTTSSLQSLRDRGFGRGDLLTHLTDRTFRDADEYTRLALDALRPDSAARSQWAHLTFEQPAYEIERGPIGFYHTGSGGQYLMVYPDLDLVVVRTRRLDSDRNSTAEEWTRRSLRMLPFLVEQAVR